MNDDVDQMIAGESILMKIIIQRKGNIPNRSGLCKFFTKAGLYNFVETKLRYPNVRIIFNLGYIIKNKWTIKGVGIKCKADD